MRGRLHWDRYVSLDDGLRVRQLKHLQLSGPKPELGFCGYLYEMVVHVAELYSPGKPPRHSRRSDCVYGRPLHKWCRLPEKRCDGKGQMSLP